MKFDFSIFDPLTSETLPNIGFQVFWVDLSSQNFQERSRSGDIVIGIGKAPSLENYKNLMELRLIKIKIIKGGSKGDCESESLAFQKQHCEVFLTIDVETQAKGRCWEKDNRPERNLS